MRRRRGGCCAGIVCFPVVHGADAVGPAIRHMGETDCSLQVKLADTEEASLAARSETRFSDPWGAIVEFQLDATGTVTGFVLQQGQVKMQA